MDNAQIVSYYSALLEAHGPTYRAGDYGSAQSRAARYRVLAGGLLALRPAKGTTLLDVGCGTGAFWDLLRDYDFGRVGQCVQYEGWDVAPALAQIARQRQWASGATIVVRDLYASTEHDAYDYVVASGLFQFASTARVIEGVERMFALARTAVVFNFLTHTDGTTPEETAHHPLSVLQVGLALTPRVLLRTDYWPNDATVVLYKAPWAPSP